MKNYLYFAEAVVESVDEGCLVAAENITGIDPLSATTTGVSYKIETGVGNADRVITLTHTTAKHKEVAEALVAIANSTGAGNDGFIVVADAEDLTATEELDGGGAGTGVFGTKKSVFHKGFNGLVTGVAIA